MADLNTFVVKDSTTIREDLLRVIKNGLIKRGVTNPNVGPNSDWFVLATALGNELAVVGANAIVKCDEQMPDTATGGALGRIAELLGLAKQPAGGSIGPVIITASATTPIPTDAELTDALGQRFAVLAGNDYEDGDQVTVYAISTGASTNLAEGTVLQWASAPPFCSDTVTVGTGGLVNGIDAEDDEALRARVLALLQTPAGSGNWEHCAEVAEQSDPRVAKAFVFPAVQGPATVDIVVAAAPTTSSKSREIDATILSGTIVPFTKGKLPEHAYVTVTTVEDVNADVAFGLSLPEAPTANPPGPGGGWLNGTPWPAPNGTSTFRCTVTAVTSSTQFTVDATTTPQAGVSRVCWLSPLDWKLYSALVTAVSGSSGALVVTLDRPFTGIFVGCYLWPAAQNAQAYVNAVLAAFALMGPGEKTSNASALVRGFRHPAPSNSWPYTLGAHLLRAISNAQLEVLSTSFLHRTDGTTTLTGTGGVVTPQVPGSAASAPRIFVPRHIGFYRIA